VRPAKDTAGTQAAIAGCEFFRKADFSLIQNSLPSSSRADRGDFAALANLLDLRATDRPVGNSSVLTERQAARNVRLCIVDQRVWR